MCVFVDAAWNLFKAGQNNDFRKNEGNKDHGDIFMW